MLELENPIDSAACSPSPTEVPCCSKKLRWIRGCDSLITLCQCTAQLMSSTVAMRVGHADNACDFERNCDLSRMEALPPYVLEMKKNSSIQHCAFHVSNLTVMEL